MATGSDLSRTLEGGHEPFFDFACTLCEGEGRHKEASTYCEECLVYMCDSCLRNHNKFPLNKRHQLFDQSQFTTQSKTAIVSFPTKRCPKHPGELINVFCGDHDVVCCSVCKAFEHSACINTKHLPDAAKDVLTSKEYQNTRKETKALISELDKVLDSRKADISRIAKEKQHIRQIIADFRRKVNKYFDDLEKKSLDELDVKEKTIIADITQDKKHIEMTKQKAEDTLKQLESFKGDNECDLFVHVKTGKQFVHDAKHTVQKNFGSEQKPSIQFEINKDIEYYISSLSNLGVFLDTSKTTPRPSSTVTKVTASRQSAPDTVKQSYSSDQVVKYDKQLFGRFVVKDTSDTIICGIGSLCQLSDGNILVLDGRNEKLKRLDHSYKLIDFLPVLDSVHSVCPLGHGQASVTLNIKRTIQLLSVIGRNLKLTTSFSVDSYCRGMCYKDGKLFICCGDVNKPSSSACIKVHNSTGQQRYSIPPAPQYLASVPLYITGSDDGQHLLVTTFDSDNITMLDMNGKVIKTFSHKNLKDPRGICTDGRGQVFVCGLNSNTVVQLSPKHQKIYVILTEADGIIDPLGICFDRKQSRLLVGCFRSNDLLVFNMK